MKFRKKAGFSNGSVLFSLSNYRVILTQHPFFAGFSDQLFVDSTDGFVKNENTGSFVLSFSVKSAKNCVYTNQLPLKRGS